MPPSHWERAFRHATGGADRRDRLAQSGASTSSSPGPTRRGASRSRRGPRRSGASGSTSRPRRSSRRMRDRAELCGTGADARACRSGALRAGGARRREEARRLLALRDPGHAAQAMERADRRRLAQWSCGASSQVSRRRPSSPSRGTTRSRPPRSPCPKRTSPARWSRSRFPSPNTGTVNYFRSQLEESQATISLRQRIAKELPL